MYKAKLAATAVKKACQLAQELGFVNSITPDRKPQVHMMHLRDVLKLPGRLTLISWTAIEPHYEASKSIDGVRFFCLITEAEYEELKAS